MSAWSYTMLSTSASYFFIKVCTTSFTYICIEVKDTYLGGGSYCCQLRRETILTQMYNYITTTIRHYTTPPHRLLHTPQSTGRTGVWSGHWMQLRVHGLTFPSLRSFAIASMSGPRYLSFSRGLHDYTYVLIKPASQTYWFIHALARSYNSKLFGSSQQLLLVNGMNSFTEERSWMLLRCLELCELG